MEKHLIVIELDNVILKEHKEITDYSKKVLEELGNLGHKIVFTTSRPYGKIMEEQHKLLGFPSIVVAGAGRSVRNNDGTTILNSSSNYKYFQEALNIGIPMLKAAIWSIGDDLYVYRHDDNLEPVINTFSGNVIRFDDILPDFSIDEAPSAAFCVPLEGKVHEFFMAMNDIDGLVGGVYDSEKSIIEVQQDDVSKKSTIEMILSSSGINEDNVIAFAASEKDLAIVKDFGHPYIMKNAPEYDKEICVKAIETGATCDDDGVAKELVKYFNLNF